MTSLTTDNWPVLTPLTTAKLPGTGQRRFWIEQVERIAGPLLARAASGELRNAGLGGRLDRPPGFHTSLEACGRTLAGLAPWLANEHPVDSSEALVRETLHALAIEALRHGTNPDDPDCWNWNNQDQCVCDAAKVAVAVLTAPRLIPGSEEDLRSALRERLESTRVITPHYNNWLLFSATIEAAIGHLGGRADLMRIDYALKQFEQWYVGDGFYKDGVEFHMDYYNSFVIHPMLLVTLEYLAGTHPGRMGHGELERQWKRAARYAEILERYISPEGTFPPVGRSLGYRFGVLGALGFVAARHKLPASLDPAQVRCAMTAVLERFAAADEMVSDDGILLPGFIGHDPKVVEFYLQDSASYLMLLPFQPLALPPEDPFWAAESTPWTALRLWTGGSVPVDHALEHHLQAPIHPDQKNRISCR